MKKKTMNGDEREWVSPTSGGSGTYGVGFRRKWEFGLQVVPVVME